MTCKEKFRQDHPEMSEFEFGLTIGSKCPGDFGYHENPAIHCEYTAENCSGCWDQPYIEEKSDEAAYAPAVQAWIEHMEEKEGHNDPVGEPGVPGVPIILDSGDRTEFATGAVRDMREGKGRCDLMPLEVVVHMLQTRKNDGPLDSVKEFMRNQDTFHLYMALELFAEKAYGDNTCTMFLEVAKHFEEGAKKYGENNWQKGIPVHCYIDSAVRHYLKWLRGDKDEPHDRAFVWNLMCCIWEVDYREKNTHAGDETSE